MKKKYFSPGRYWIRVNNNYQVIRDDFYTKRVFKSVHPMKKEIFYVSFDVVIDEDCIDSHEILCRDEFEAVARDARLKDSARHDFVYWDSYLNRTTKSKGHWDHCDVSNRSSRSIEDIIGRKICW